MAEMIRIADEDITAEISPIGAELRSLKYRGRELLWQADPAFWGQTSPLLFPICGRAIGNRVTINGVEYPMTIHGFAMESRFELTEANAWSCMFSLGPDESIRAIYPFDFELIVSYRLQHRSHMSCMVAVKNKGDVPLPFSFGFHPGLAFPLPGLEGEPHEFRLFSGDEPAIAEQRDNFLTGARLASPFRDGGLVVSDQAFSPSSSIIIPEGSGQGAYYGAGEGRRLKLLWHGTENLVLWRPQGAGFLCVEPWQGLPSQIGAGPELSARPCSKLLDPGQKETFGLVLIADEF